MEMKKVELYTDGACSGNPGPGGWGAILRYGSREKELSGGEFEPTNNRMEITAVLEGLSALKEPCRVDVYSDSKYVVDAVNLGWAKKWRANGWKRNKKDKALNADLWQKLLSLLEIHSTVFHWVKGHSGYAENERCDALATAQVEKYHK